MARKRMLDPTIWADEDFNNLSSDGKIMFIGMISNSDDEGILPGNALYLTANIFPYSGISLDDATLIRNEVLICLKGVFLYEIDKKQYILLDNFDQYQYIQRPTQTKYRKIEEEYVIDTISLREQSRAIEEKRKEGKGREVRREGKEENSFKGGKSSETLPTTETENVNRTSELSGDFESYQEEVEKDME